MQVLTKKTLFIASCKQQTIKGKGQLLQQVDYFKLIAAKTTKKETCSNPNVV